MSLFTGVKATEPRTSIRCQISYIPEASWVFAGIPKRVHNDSAASRNGEVSMALSWLASKGTSVNDLLRLLKNVPLFAVAILNECRVVNAE